jgi:COP9 signalosome complex subunit 5
VTSQIADLTHKLYRTEASVTSRAGIAHLAPDVAKAKQTKDKGDGAAQKQEDTALGKAIKDSDAVDSECRHGLFAQRIKVCLLSCEARLKRVQDAVFNFRMQQEAQAPPQAAAVA